MGLDMYLTGRKFFAADRPKDSEGYDVESVVVDLGYWRKHANLHGYIVNTFADGKDECQEIELSMENLTHLLEVVKEPTKMPKTEGFFFGVSANDDEQIADDVAIIGRAIGFLSVPAIKTEKGIWRSCIYRASW